MADRTTTCSPSPIAAAYRPPSSRFDPETVSGLTANDVLQSRKQYGYNELPTSNHRSIVRILLDVLREPMFLLLVACGLLYLILGDIGEAIMLMSFVVVVIGITLYQEQKTERALEALRDLSSPRALVIRDGRQQRIAGREVVVGDVLLLNEGDRVPADAMILDSVNLAIDESLLTGESVPVRKHPAEGEPGKPDIGGDDTPFVFSGTMTVQGQGIARVLNVGAETMLGKIGRSLESVQPEQTRLSRETGRLVKVFALLGSIMCAILIVVYGLTRGLWLKAVLSGITLAMAMLPEEFPVVLTVFLALGAWRISKSGVLTRRIPAVETLGSATVLCTDKTGTVTQNRMTVSALCVNEATIKIANDTALPDEYHALLEYGVLAGRKTPVDPMEKAILDLTTRKIDDHLHADWELVQEYPLCRNMLAMSNVWSSPDRTQYIIAAKGAPETIADLCHLAPEALAAVNQRATEMANGGLRVLGVASTVYPLTELPAGQHDFDFVFHGLIGLSDPPRPEVREAMHQCHEAGIRVVMITGDYPGTALNIAKEVEMPSDGVLTGAEIDQLDDAALQERVGTVNIFARAIPDHKLRIVNALKKRGEIVAMTGDGVNDAPALKSAHIGIAMGERGTDVAREAASLVLIHDDFASMVSAVRVGRRIYDNLQKAIAYIISVHIPIAGITLLPVVLLNRDMVLLPIHIVVLELIIDPACSIVFEMESEEPDIMRRPPRNLHEPLFGWSKIGVSLLQGTAVLLIIAGIYFLGDLYHRNPDETRAFVFTTLIMSNLALIITNRSWHDSLLTLIRRPNRAMSWLFIGVTVFLTLILGIAPVRGFFHFQTLHLIDIAICLGAGLLGITWFEGLKLFWRKRKSFAA